MIGRGRPQFADRAHRAVDRESSNGRELYSPAVDDRETGSDAGRLDRLAVIAIEMRAAAEVETEGAAPDREVAAVGGERPGDVSVVVLCIRAIGFVHRRYSVTSSRNPL